MSTQSSPVTTQQTAADTDAPALPGRYARFGEFRADLQREELYRDGQRVKMQAKLYQALLLLLKRRGEIVTRHEVCRWLWPDSSLVNLDANVNTTMNKLRQVLGDSPENPVYIETVPRRGYSFVAATGFSDQPEPPAMPVAPPSTSVTEPSAAPVLGRVFPRHRSALLHAATLLVAGMIVGALLAFVWFFAQQRSRRSMLSGKQSVSLSITHSARGRL